MVENVLNVMEDINLNIQVSQQTLGMINSNPHGIVKSLKEKDKSMLRILHKIKK